MAEVVVDDAVLQALVDALGDRELVRTIVATYLSELDGRIEAIAAAAPSERAAAAHALKSPSVTLGVVAMELPSRRVELAPHDEAVLREAMTALRASRGAVAAALTVW